MFRQKPGILLIDDDRHLQAKLRRILELSGFDVWVADQQQEALTLFRHHSDRCIALLLAVEPLTNGRPQALGLLLEPSREDILECLNDYTIPTFEKITSRGNAMVIDKPTLLKELAKFLEMVGLD